MISGRQKLALRFGIGFMVAVTMLAGCRSGNKVRFEETNLSAISYSTQMERPIEYPDVRRTIHSAEYALPPLTSADELPPKLNVTVDEVIQLALNNTKILRSLNAQILSNPRGAAGVFDPAINATDPIFGIEAALSAFDANLSASLNHANNDNVFNNSILGGGATEVVQDLTTANLLLQKTGATGTQYSLQSNLIYDSNDNIASTFPSSYSGFWEAQVRHPLLQGNGVDFNRIAGPNATPGFRNTSGVLISRINNDISIAQFEQNLREFVNEVITSYWNLQIAYREFDASKGARDASLETWNTVKARFDNDLPGGEADKEAQAREQYYSFEQQLITALNGEARNGRTGILQAEANLRRLIGLPQNDGRLLRPTDEPAATETIYDWGSLVNTALDRRVEVRQQLWQVKRRELELLASRNFLLPRLDAVATYRNNGFGDDLIGGGGRFSSALSDLASGDHNEWELGVQLNVPVGYRQASTGVRNAQLQLFRENAILDEQEKQIIHELGTAVRQSRQFEAAIDFAYNRVAAARDTVDSRQAAFEADTVPLDLLLESQSRLAQAETSYYQTQVNQQLAFESVLRESGQMLIGHGITLNQEPSSNSAGVDVNARRSRLANTIPPLDYRTR